MKTFRANFLESLIAHAGTLTFDYAGVCSSAQDVPGNFLEKHSLAGGKLIFAIGDTGVIPDPLPSLCVRHFLRRGLGEKSNSPAMVADNINRLVYDCCAAECSLSCFYAEFDSHARTLRYVNAGHDAPLLVRSNSDEVIRLDEGGPVFGLLESPNYTEGVVTLRKGDRLVAFTQGVIDALADRDNCSAESLLIALIRNRERARAFQLAQRIVTECEPPGFDKRTEKSVFVACVDETNPLFFNPCMEETRADAYSS